MTDQPVGEWPDITPMVSVAAGDLCELHDRIELLELKNRQLELLLHQARNERDDANIRAWARGMAP